jgi:hypothetical protein
MELRRREVSKRTSTGMRRRRRTRKQNTKLFPLALKKTYRFSTKSSFAIWEMAFLVAGQRIRGAGHAPFSTQIYAESKLCASFQLVLSRPLFPFVLRDFMFLGRSARES